MHDAIGERTLFHVATAASGSLRALRRVPGRRPQDLDSVRAFLTFAYVPGEGTLLEGVRELRPGTTQRLGAAEADP